MLTKESLEDLLQSEELSNTDKLLLCLSIDAQKEKQVKEILTIAMEAGLRSAKSWNISRYLSGTKGLAIRATQGWKLTSRGKTHVQSLVGATVNPVKVQTANNLRHCLNQISDPNIAAFVEEAIKCYEANLYRAAVVLSWVGAISVLYKHTVQLHLKAFNQEASKRDSRWRNAKTEDDLTRMTEADFLNILEAISVFGKSTKQELEKLRQLRNGCGHPNTFKVGEHMVTAHIEALVLNVFSKYTV